MLAITELVRAWKAAGRPGGRDGLLVRLAAAGGVYVPRFYDVSYGPAGAISAGAAQPAGGAALGVQAHRDGPGLLAVPGQAAGAAGRDCARAVQRGDLPRLHQGLPVLPGRDDHQAGPGAIDHDDRRRWSRPGWPASGFTEVGLLSLSSADHSEINEIAVDLADRYEGTNTGLSLPSTRVDAFNVTLADELSRNGRRSGLTFAPEGGSDRIRKVINKMVTEDDLIKTVTTAYASGWRQVKLYFMCGLPTETDEDVLAIAALAQRVIQAGRSATGRHDIRCTVSIGGFVPKPHTPFQWAAQCSHETVDARLRALGAEMRADRGLRQGDRVPLPRRQAVDRRGAAVARRPAGGEGHPGRRGRTAAGSTAGARHSRSSAGSGARLLRWPRTAWTWPGTPPGSAATTRSCRGTTWMPGWSGTGCGRTGWRPSTPTGAAEVEDCRWTPCFRVRRLPGDGHRDPGRADREAAAAAGGNVTPPGLGRAGPALRRAGASACPAASSRGTPAAAASGSAAGRQVR